MIKLRVRIKSDMALTLQLMAKVTRSAIQNASSVAAMVLTTESLVTDIKDPQADAAQAAALAAAQGGGMY